MIFVMITGSYTPFALNALRPPLGALLCGAVWTLAAAGIALKLACYHPFQHVSVALYLGMGWLLLPIIRAFATALHGDMLLILLAGGAVFTLRSFVHARARIPFHNAVCQTMVLIGASLQFVAVGRGRGRGGRPTVSQQSRGGRACPDLGRGRRS